MTTSITLSLGILLCYNLLSVHGVIVYTNNFGNILPSYYSTLGTYPTESKTHRISIVDSDSIYGCNLNVSRSSAGSVRDSIMVFKGGVPMFHACSVDRHAATTILAVLAQQHGALGVIVEQSDREFANGRALGFTSRVTIPVLVAPSSTMEILSSFTHNDTMVQLPSVTPSERKIINSMLIGYTAWQFITICVYSTLSLMTMYSMGMEMYYVHLTRKKWFSHTCILKLSAMFAAITTLLWAAVDPFGFKGSSYWQSGIVLDILKGAIIVVYLLVLRTWIKVVGIVNNSKFLRVTISRSCYGASVVIMMISIFSGTVWYNHLIDYMFAIFTGVMVSVLGAGYAVVGKTMLSALVNSGNAKSSKSKIICKIAGFIVYYGVATLVGVFVVFLHIFNHLYTEMVCTLTHGFGLIITFIILYFRHNPNSKRPGKSAPVSPRQSPMTSFSFSFSASPSSNPSPSPNSSPGSSLGSSIFVKRFPLSPTTLSIFRLSHASRSSTSLLPVTVASSTPPPSPPSLPSLTLLPIFPCPAFPDPPSSLLPSSDTPPAYSLPSSPSLTVDHSFLPISSSFETQNIFNVQQRLFEMRSKNNLKIDDESRNLEMEILHLKEGYSQQNESNYNQIDINNNNTEMQKDNIADEEEEEIKGEEEKTKDSEVANSS